MKRFLILFLIVLALCLVITGCNSKGKPEPTVKTATTDYFNLELGDDGTWMIDSVTSHTFSEIEIPESYDDIPITTIKKDAFADCSKITSIRIPKTITYIGSDAFSGCAQLREIFISNKDTYITKSAFASCPIKSAQVPSAHIEILPTAELEEIYLLDGTVEDSAFSGFYSLRTVAIVGDVSFEENALYGCSAITFKLPPEKIKSFSQKEKVYSLIVAPSLVENPSMVISIKAFDGYTTLGNVTFEPCEVPYIFNEGAFENCIATSFTIDASLLGSIPTTTETLTITSGDVKYLGTTRNLNLKMLIIRPEVTSIEDSAFRECTSLTSVSVLAKVDKIKSYTFYKCSNLTSIELSSTIKTLGQNSFAYCSSLGQIDLGSSIATIEKNAFKDCKALASVRVKSNVKSIGESAFENCTALTTLNIGSGLNSLDLSAFMGCTSIKFITIDEANTAYAFENGALLTANKKTLIKFVNAEATEYTVPDTVEVINAQAFYGNLLLESIIISNSVKTIGAEAFLNCQALKSITLGTGIETIEKSTFKNCEALESITLSSSIKVIGKDAFYGCSALASVTLNDTLTEIGATAFYGCDALSTITIPKSVKMVGERCFASCDSLETIYIASTTHDSTFDDRWANGCDAVVYTIDDKE
jgi:hypothetical protein